MGLAYHALEKTNRESLNFPPGIQAGQQHDLLVPLEQFKWHQSRASFAVGSQEDTASLPLHQHQSDSTTHTQKTRGEVRTIFSWSCRAAVSDSSLRPCPELSPKNRQPWAMLSHLHCKEIFLGYCKMFSELCFSPHCISISAIWCFPRALWDGCLAFFSYCPLWAFPALSSCHDPQPWGTSARYLDLLSGCILGNWVPGVSIRNIISISPQVVFLWWWNFDFRIKMIYIDICMYIYFFFTKKSLTS